MTQLRIVTNNVADSAALTVSNTAPGMGADKLKTDIKSQVCRVLANSALIVASWVDPKQVAAVVIPASNLNASSTIRVQVFSDQAGTILVWDSGVRYAAPGQLLINEDFTQPLNVNRFAFDFPPSTAVYLPQQEMARCVKIQFDDADATFLDFSRLIIGPTISTYNLDIPYGQSDGVVDQSSNSRTASGDIKTDIGPKSKKLMFDLSFIGPEDRSAVKRVLENGIGKFMWVSLMAEDADPELERDKSIYGKLTRVADMQWANYASHTTQFELES